MPISNTAPDQRIWVTRNNGGAGFIRLDRDDSDTAVNQMDVYANTPGIIHPNDIVFDTVHGLYFFADSVNGNRRILQGNISDLLHPSGPPALTVLYSDTSPGTAGGQILGLAIDVDASTGQGALYFVNKGNLDRVVYDHDGTSPTNQTPAILAQLPAGSFANEIALDLDHHQAFILSTASTTTPTEVPEGTPGAMFDDDAGVWFINATDVTNNEIWKVSGLDRTDSSTADTSISRLNWVGGDNGGQDLQDSKGLLQSIDVDPTTGMLYFTTQQINSGAFGEVGGIYRYNLSTGTYETLYTEGNSTDYSFEYIHVDPATGRYYVSNASFDDNTNADTSSIFVHDLSPGTPTLFANVGNAGGAIPQGLTVVDAPTLNGTETGATTTESAGPGSGQSSAAFALASPDAHDSDSAGQVDQLAGAQVRISSGFGSSPGSTELLTINGTTSGVLDFGSQDIAYSYNSATGVMTLTGASTFADYDAALSLVAYSISGDNPDNFGAAPTRTLAYSVFDGMLYSDEYDATVHIQATDDAPVNGTGGPVATSEDSASVAIAGLSVSDVDSGALTVTLSVGRGTLAIDTSVSGGLSAGEVSGNGTGTVTITASQAEINATFAAATGVAYTPTPNVNGADTLTMTTNDGSLQDVDTVAINVAAVNDAPTVAGDGTESAAPIVEDQPSATGQTVSSLFAGQYSDATDQVPGGSSADAFAGVAVTANGSGAAGQWQYYNGAAWVDIGPASTGAAVLLAAGTSIRFDPAANFNGAAPTLTVHLVDASGGALTDGAHADLSTTGGTTPYSSGTVVLDETVTADNDAPVNVVPGAVSTSEDAISVPISGLSVSDVDSPSLTVTLSVGRGTLAIDTSVAGGLSAGEVSGNGTGTVTITASQAEINATFAAAHGVAYTPTPNVNGPDSLHMTTSDGAASDSDSVTINVAAINDAPTVAGDGTESAAPIFQGAPSATGQSVASLFAGQYSDATDQVPGGSSADPFAGVAVTSNGSGASGQWQYYNGATWVNVGAASDSAAVLLAAGSSVRFNPAPGFNGPAPTLTAHLVDGSAGALTSGAIVDASATGGITRYSTGTVVLSEQVIATNTPPTGVTGTLQVNEDSHNGTVVGTLHATDPDSTTFTYSLVNDAGGRFDINATTGVVTVENGLLLDYEQANHHTIRVQVDDHEGGVSQFDVNVAVNDVHGEFVVGDNAGNTFYGGAETDILLGSHGSDTIHGGGGSDIIAGGNGLFDATDGGDFLFGDGGDDVIDGNGGDDVIAGGTGSDVITGAEGNDTIYGGDSATDTTETGNDILSGDAGNDIIYGNGGNDSLYGGDDNDQLFGGAGSDTLDGGNGNDVLNGGAGADTLTGGAGNDVFVFHKGEANGDVVTDFNGNGAGAGDSIRLEGYAAGTTFTQIGHSGQWKINDHGFIEIVTLQGHPNVHPTDVTVVP